MVKQNIFHKVVQNCMMQIACPFGSKCGLGKPTELENANTLAETVGTFLASRNFRFQQACCGLHLETGDVIKTE